MARWLAAEPRVLLLNDPTRGVDLGAKRDLYALLTQLAENGLAVVMRLDRARRARRADGPRARLPRARAGRRAAARRALAHAARVRVLRRPGGEPCLTDRAPAADATPSPSRSGSPSCCCVANLIAQPSWRRAGALGHDAGVVRAVRDRGHGQHAVRARRRHRRLRRPARQLRQHRLRLRADPRGLRRRLPRDPDRPGARRGGRSGQRLPRGRRAAAGGRGDAGHVLRPRRPERSRRPPTPESAPANWTSDLARCPGR